MDRIALHDGWVDARTGEVHRSQPVGVLRQKERALLVYLAERPGLTIARSELYQALWGYHPDTKSRTLDTTIRRVRELIEADPSRPRLIATEPSVGYRFEPPAVENGSTELQLASATEALVAAVAQSERTWLWGPPGAGKSRLLAELVRRVPQVRVVDDAQPAAVDEAERTGAKLVFAGRIRCRRPGVRVVEVAPLSPEQARALVARRLAELGSQVAPPEASALAVYDGLPGALLLAAERAELWGGLPPPPTDDAISRAFSSLLSGLDLGLLGAVAAVGSLPSEIVVPVAGEQTVRDWLERGLVRREGISFRVLEHVRRQDLPADTAASEALRQRLSERLSQALHPFLGPTRPPELELLLASGPMLAICAGSPDPVLRRARAHLYLHNTASDLTEAEWAQEVALWARITPNAEAVFARIEGLPEGPARGALRCRALRLTGRSSEALALVPDASDRSLEAGEWAHQLAITMGFNANPRGTVTWAREALERWRGHEVLERKLDSPLAHAYVLLGELPQAIELYERMISTETERPEGLIGMCFVELNRLQAEAARTYALAARSEARRLPDTMAIQLLCQVGIALRELGELDGARAALQDSLSLSQRAKMSAHVEGHLRYAYGTVLLALELFADARVFLARASEVFTAIGRPEMASAADCMVALAHELEGHVDEGHALLRGLLDNPCPPSRTWRLVVLLSVGVAEPAGLAAIEDILAFSDATQDRALRGMAMLARQLLGGPEPSPEDLPACSFEIRLMARVVAARRYP